MKKLLYCTLGIMALLVPAGGAHALSQAECTQRNTSETSYTYDPVGDRCEPRVRVYVSGNTGTGGGAQSTSQPFCTGGKCTYVALEPIPGLPDCYGPNPPAKCLNATTDNFAGWVANGFKIFIGVGALVAIIMLIIGAMTYMFSDVVGKKKDALDRIRAAMWGIVLLLSSYLILFTINPDLTIFKAIKLQDNFNTQPAAGTGAQAPATTPSGTTGDRVYNGPDAHFEVMQLQDKCQPPKALHSTGGGTDSRGAYVVWECK